jgi:HSP20 family protein
LRREGRSAAPVDPIDALAQRLEAWARGSSLGWPAMLGWDIPGEQMIRVDQYREGNAIVVRAELPGIDPDKDVHVCVTDHALHIEAERHEEESTERNGYVRKELRSGSFSRRLPLPDDIEESDITADYKDGILTVRVPTNGRPPEKTIPIKKS